MRPSHCCLFLTFFLAIHVHGEELPSPVDVFLNGQDGYFAFRIPALIASQQGTLLAFCEGRKTNLGDDGDNDLVLRRSTDSGRSWHKLQLVHEEGGDAIITVGNPCPVIDPATGRIFLAVSMPV